MMIIKKNKYIKYNVVVSVSSSAATQTNTIPLAAPHTVHSATQRSYRYLTVKLHRDTQSPFPNKRIIFGCSI